MYKGPLLDMYHRETHIQTSKSCLTDVKACLFRQTEPAHGCLASPDLRFASSKTSALGSISVAPITVGTDAAPLRPPSRCCPQAAAQSPH